MWESGAVLEKTPICGWKSWNKSPGRFGRFIPKKTIKHAFYRRFLDNLGKISRRTAKARERTRAGGCPFGRKNPLVFPKKKSFF